MINQYFEIARLIAKQISGELDKEEQIRLENWRKESPENERLFDEIRNEENITANLRRRNSFNTDMGWEKVNEGIHKYRFRKRVFRICRYAAMLAMPLVIAALVTFQIINENKNDKTIAATEQILPGSTKATLTLDNGEIVDLIATKGERLEESDGTLIKIDSATLNYKHGANAADGKIAYNKVSVPRGGEYKLVLSDGTRIHLNSMSSLRYPVSFGSKTRQVELDGEAYFEVSKTGQPFIVNANGIDVEVLGTTFNLSAYKDEPRQTTLVSGSVRVRTGNGNSRIIKPSQQASIAPGANQIDVRTVDTAFYTSWIHGKIKFKDQRLEDIMKTLSRWYDMDIVYADKEAKNLRFGCYVNRYEEISPLLELLRNTGSVKIETKGKTIKIHTNHK
ncbi:FecR domain-containing protein [uncultured Prevotella sp.]|uniref:FecR family protein n=1 Tax=uncultured Prevotella sp. TaxID=159272 RepID=UPI002621E7B2|nr:FecR domain-containing protein [uncultured Prevotella sp.]